MAIECSREQDVLDAITAGRWPDAAMRNCETTSNSAGFARTSPPSSRRSQRSGCRGAGYGRSSVEHRLVARSDPRARRSSCRCRPSDCRSATRRGCMPGCRRCCTRAACAHRAQGDRPLRSLGCGMVRSARGRRVERVHTRHGHDVSDTTVCRRFDPARPDLALLRVAGGMTQL